MKLMSLFLLAAGLPAQDLRITAQTLSVATTRAMFGKLPRQVKAASIQVCNQTAQALTVPLSRVAQEVKLAGGITILPRDAALAVVSQAQGRSPWATAFRWIGAGTGTVSTLATLRVFDANATWGSLIIFAATVVGVAAQQFAGAAPTHPLLEVSTEALPDPLQMVPLACAQGITLIERDASTGSIDFQIALPVKKESEP